MDQDAWNRRYAGVEPVWAGEANRFLREEVGELPPGRALDLACGEGRNAIWLAERDWSVTAVDFSGVGIDKGRRWAASRGIDRIRWELADLDDYVPPERAFDLVIVFYLHLPRVPMSVALQRAAGAVAPSGTFLLVGHDRTNLDRGHGGPQSPDVLYTAEDVVAELGELRVIEAGTRQRAVDLAGGGVATAIDVLVRADRP